MAGKRNVVRCRSCDRPFRRRTTRQVYCHDAACRIRRRNAYMRAYMAHWKKRNPAYWKTKRQYDYLRRWRQAHPGYFRLWRAEKKIRKK